MIFGDFSQAVKCLLDFTQNDNFGQGKHVAHCLVKLIGDYRETLHPQLMEVKETLKNRTHSVPFFFFFSYHLIPNHEHFPHTS